MLARSGALDALDFEPPQGLREPRGADRLLGRARTTSAPRPRSASSARRPTPCPRRGCRSPRTGRRWSGWRRSTRRSASTSPATRSTTTPAALRREQVADPRRARCAGPPADGRRSPSIAGTVAALDQRKSARGTRFAFVRLSDPTGLYEVRMFSDVLDAGPRPPRARPQRRPDRRGDARGRRAAAARQAAQPIDAAVAGAASAGPARLRRRRRRRALARHPPRRRRPRGRRRGGAARSTSC